MGNKPIEFETYEIRDERAARICVTGRRGGITLDSTINSSTHVHVFTDSADLDALADAIKRAADALRKANTLTFADLKPGEWFRWKRDGVCGGLRKVDENTIIVVDNIPPSWNCVDVVVHGAWAYTEVIRVTATFTPADAEVGK